MVKKFAASVVDTKGATCNLTCEYLRKFSKKFEPVLMEYSGRGETDSLKNQKFHDNVPLNLRTM